MEVDLVARGIPVEDTFEVDDNNNTNIDVGNLEEERCGICMDVVIDRGVLDCCQHWFCFVCIDNWATITNLCPLCQNEFQLITCVPVYDTIGSIKVDEDSFSRDDDWCIEEKNNTLSFPSYYIDENAVICLDGDGCKIRSGSVTIDGDSNLDTSIACDSCDIWYHAFCVGFDSEATNESTWLCPRCVPQSSDVTSIQRPNNQCGPDNANSECFVQDAFSGKVSISVADAGETAVVVSMVAENQWAGEPNDNFLSTAEVKEDLKAETFMLASDAISHKVETRSADKTLIQPTFEGKELELSLSYDASFILPSNSSVLSELKTSSADKAMNEQSSFNCIGNTSRTLTSESLGGNRQSEDESTIGLHLGLSVGAFLTVDDIMNDVRKEQVAEVFQEQIPSEESSAKVDKFELDANEDAARMVGAKRKFMDYSEPVSIGADDGDSKPKVLSEVSRKKIRDEGRIQQMATKDEVDASVPDNSQRCPTPVAVPKDERVKHRQDKEDTTSCIMNIVQDTSHRPCKGIARPNPAGKSSIERENTAGLRVKKIMRRASDDKDSSMVVQKLRKEIREAVRQKSSKDFGESLFDPKLLAAFRAAIAGPKTEPVKKLSPSAIKTKKSMLQKGKVRENLTKKIYGSTNGRRKRAWDRDCEVEFWKHRCMGATKPEKIKTLKSVLGLLRNSLDSSDQGSESQATNPILSRLYLADTSVFPRKDNLMPLSALKTAGNSEQKKEQLISTESCSKESHDKSTMKFTESNKVLSKAGIPSFDIKENTNNVPISKGVIASAPSKIHLSTPPEGSSISTESDSKVSTKKQLVVKSDNIKSDKRKWAMEVLARKTAFGSKNTIDELHEDNAVLKRNCPLLAQLPADMRPVLATSRHNKIPLSVRQAQLYRLTEHFLRKANLPVIRRTAETELAVADATNIEREVADRSNSKLVYINLCSQELLHHSDNSKTTQSNASPSTEFPIDGSEQATNRLSTDPVILEALRNAGLVSDSPPNSPQPEQEVVNEDDPSITKDGLEDVFDINSHPELDIYGDFEYDLEDEDYIGASSVKVSMLPPEEGSSKMKVVFSTLNSEKLNNGLDIGDLDKSGNAEAPRDSTLFKNSSDAAIDGASGAGENDNCCVPPQLSINDDSEEPSIDECEELYGPDKEPLIKKFPEVASRKLVGQVDTADLTVRKDPIENENYVSNKVVKASEAGSTSNLVDMSRGREHSPNQFETEENVENAEKKLSTEMSKQSDSSNPVLKKVEAYIKEHIRPLCKSGIITAEQYRWAVAKTTDKVMRYHSKAKNANFLIKEGEKVKKLAEQYVETAQQKEKSDSL